MANSLQDQLLKAGLVDKKKSQQIKKQKQQAEKLQRKHKVSTEDDKVDITAVRQAEAEKSRELNRKRDEEAQARAIMAQIKQMIETSHINHDKGELAFHFKHGTLVKQIYVTAEQQAQLERGQLAIVSFEDRYRLVPRIVAQKIAERDAGLVIFLNEPGYAGQHQADEDDPYKDFVIPDDLMW
ncbi:DUF2058 domain-containing protein [Gynuella sunshinyii]|uniref:Nucleoprotein/polynucleotide-associated enzyme n=1 Tax=Gynuella sunshinyii YC6258 TaxID=1445510 RepID=A0A0C5W529_9GAMM|nr:DUF2058 domain-containing protein [Gynuella sunshinyii]AJQ97704.1 hypothetical protein YC6258_05676 [Gynuella sunshinyii YC6258]